MTGQPIVLSHVQVAPLLRARDGGATEVITSTDLGLSAASAALGPEGATFPSGARLRWDDAARIAGDRNKCFTLDAGGIHDITAFSEATGWVRGLMPTAGAPTMLVSGIPMHRIRDLDPWQDTLLKARALAPLVGTVLDTATGLGYTAIVAARTAEEVITIELDPAALAIARLNPWSRDLFTAPNIRQVIGDAAEIVPTFADASFTRVIHDPPTQSLGGDLYGLAFYRELRRVLRRGGRLFHYIGDPASPSGKRTTEGVLRRLHEAGFARVVRRPEAFGVLAYG